VLVRLPFTKALKALTVRLPGISSTAPKVLPTGAPSTSPAIRWFSPATFAKVKSWFTLWGPTGAPADYAATRGVRIYFDFDRASLRPESEPVLQKIADILARHPDWKLSLTGHTDNTGPDAYNLDLSNRRARAVKRALVGSFDIAADRLTTEGLGATRPSAPNDSKKGRAHNRRVELAGE
jgi:outer membrane protein OmpA-like peptidoglycan-associated protein